eukprot:scpid52770/ scgid27927/ Protein aurora borealis
MASIVDTPRSRYQRTSPGSTQTNGCTTTAITSDIVTTATPKQPAKLQNPFSGESTCARENFPDFSPSVFTHKETPAESRSEKRFQWSIDEMANLQPADIDERTAQAFHCTPRRDSAKQVALNRFFLQQQVVASPYVTSSLSLGRKTAVKHVTFSPLPPATKYITRDEDYPSGDSSCDLAMDVSEEMKRHSVCTQTSATLMETDETLPPNCVQMESMAELKDLSYSSLRRKLFGPCDRSSPDLGSRENSPSLKGEDGSGGKSNRFPDTEEPSITPGQFLSMSSEDEDECDMKESDSSRRPSWGRCSSSPTGHLHEECMGLYSSPIGLMEDPIFTPLPEGCIEEEDFDQIGSLDLSPISASHSESRIDVENSPMKGITMKPMTSTLCNAPTTQSYPVEKENDQPMDSRCVSMFEDEGRSHPGGRNQMMTPLGDRSNQPSTLRVSQLTTPMTSASFSGDDSMQDVPMSHGVCPQYTFLSRHATSRLDPLQSDLTGSNATTGSLTDTPSRAGSVHQKEFHSWSYQGSTPVSRHQHSKQPAVAYDDWQRSVDSWQHSIRQQLADFDQGRGMSGL